MLKIIQLIVLFCTNVYVSCFLEPGYYKYYVNQDSSLIAVSKIMYSNSKIYVKIACENSSLDYRISWILRYSPCGDEFSFINDRADLIDSYFNTPFIKPLQFEYDNIELITSSNYPYLQDVNNAGNQFQSCNSGFIHLQESNNRPLVFSAKSLQLITKLHADHVNFSMLPNTHLIDLENPINTKDLNSANKIYKSNSSSVLNNNNEPGILYTPESFAQPSFVIPSERDMSIMQNSIKELSIKGANIKNSTIHEEDENNIGKLRSRNRNKISSPLTQNLEESLQNRQRKRRAPLSVLDTFETNRIRYNSNKSKIKNINNMVQMNDDPINFASRPMTPPLKFTENMAENYKDMTKSSKSIIAHTWKNGNYLLIMRFYLITPGVNRNSYAALTDLNEINKILNPPTGLTVEIWFKSPKGTYLSAHDWPMLPFYACMLVLYIIYVCLWTYWCIRYRKELLRIQYCIAGVIFLGFLEKAMFLGEYQTVNLTGESIYGALVSAELVSALKRSLSRILIIIASIGYGIVKPRLGSTMKRVLALGGAYFIFASIDGILRVSQHKASNPNLLLFATLPIALLDTLICWWAVNVKLYVFSGLVNTLRILKVRNNVVKLNVYRSFTNVLVFCVTASIIFMLWSFRDHKLTLTCNQNWAKVWLDEAFWHFLFSLILLAIMILWRPSANNQRYAYTPLLDNPEYDDSDAEEYGLSGGHVRLNSNGFGQNGTTIANKRTFSNGKVKRINTKIKPQNNFGNYDSNTSSDSETNPNFNAEGEDEIFNAASAKEILKDKAANTQKEQNLTKNSETNSNTINTTNILEHTSPNLIDSDEDEHIKQFEVGKMQ